MKPIPIKYPSVHPHACGEIYASAVWCDSVIGTSPRLWGDFCQWMSIGRQGVHPHACGEIGTIYPPIYAKPGTSPRLWGDYNAPTPHRQHIRYIPTLVGRLKTTNPHTSQTPVHPHACGEIDDLTRQVKAECGTSPRLWGDFISGPSVSRLWRYIPTLVGRLHLFRFLMRLKSVHPHACGEIITHNHLTLLDNGTSPRLWGD